MVRAGAKGHAGVNFNNKVIILGLVFFPRRLNNKVFADMGYMEILLPFVCPILLAQCTEQRIAENAFLLDTLFNGFNLARDKLQTFGKFFIVRVISRYGNNLGILLFGNIAQLPCSACAQLIN